VLLGVPLAFPVIQSPMPAVILLLLNQTSWAALLTLTATQASYGLVAFFQETVGGTAGDTEAIFVFDSNTGGFTEVIRGGAVPGEPGATFGAAVDNNSISINESGNLAFISEINPAGGGTNQEVVTVFSGGTLEVLAREGAAAPGGGNFDTSGTIFDADELVFSESNQLVFQADLVGGGEGLFFDTDTTATVDSLLGDSSSRLNSAGQFAFSLSLSNDAALGISAISDDLVVIGDINDPSSFTVVAREGDAAGNGLFFDSAFDDQLNINEAGQVLFGATGLDAFPGAGFGATDGNIDSGVFFFDPVEGLQLVLQEGQVLLPGDPLFGSRLDVVAGTDQLVLLDDGSFVVEFATETDTAVDVGAGLFFVQFTPAAAAVPEPSSAMLIALFGMGSLMRRRRK